MFFEQFINVFAARKLLFQASEHPKLLVSGAYSGFDPTAKSLHIGNIIPILGLILCGKIGIQPYALIGSATTIIGDPTGRKDAKEILSESEICNNASSVLQQIKNIYEKGMKILNSQDHKPIKFVDNLTWFKEMNFIDFLANMGRHVKVNSMLSRNCVQSRLNSEEGLNFCELSYQLMQGYDFFHLKKYLGVNVQIGGSDQWGNMVAGTELISKKLKEDAAFITLPLLTTSNGVKMGKSSGNGVWLDPGLTSIYDFYQYFVSLNDNDALHILPLLNVLNNGLMNEVKEKHISDPSSHYLQKYLAKYMTTLVHGENAASQADLFSNALFSGEGQFELPHFDFESLVDSSRYKKIPRALLHGTEITACRLFKLIFPELSNNQIRNSIKSGSVKFNRKKVVEPEEKIRIEELKDHFLVNHGKTSFFIVKIEN